MEKKMNRTKDTMIKILLTIPAIFVGILSAVLYIFKPVIELWSPPEEDIPTPIPEEEKHDFH